MIKLDIFNTILFGIVTVFIYGIYWYGYGRFQYFKKRGIPYLKPNWFVGNILNIKAPGETISDSAMKLSKKFNSKTFGCFLMGLPMYITTDPKLFREISTTKFDCFRDRMMYHDRPYPHNLMLGWMVGERWKSLRAKLSPLFTTTKLKLMMELMKDAAQSCVELLEESANSEKEASLRKIGTGYSTESILSASFGLEAKNQSETNKRIVEFGNEFFAGQGPIWRLMQWLPFAEYFIKYIPNPIVRAIAEIHKEVQVLFANRKSGEIYRNDLFQYMIDTQPEKDGMTDDEVMGSAINFMSAGQETAGTTLSSSLYEIAKNQTYQQRLFDEVKACWKDTSVPITYEEIESLKFLDMFVREVLRFHSPAPMVVRSCKKECVVKGIKFEPYVYVAASVYCIHRDPEAYEKPMEFYPEHFTEEASKNRYEFSWMPFGGGPRICLGYRFALLEIKVAIATIVRKFKLTPGSNFPEKLTIEQRITNIIKDEIPCKVEKRLE